MKPGGRIPSSLRPEIMNKLTGYLFIILLAACVSKNTETGRYYSSWDEKLDVKDKVKELDFQEVLISSNSIPYIMGNYLLIVDPQSLSEQIHVFDKNSFKYLVSFGHRGGGPGEITGIGNLGLDEKRNRIYISDFGKQKIVYCHMDSVLDDSTYRLKEIVSLEQKQFPSEYVYINDSLCVGRFIFPLNAYDYCPKVARWNMYTNEYKVMDYEYPGIKHKRMTCGVSAENQLYVECYANYDLLTVGDFEGNLKCNIHGPLWKKEPSKDIRFYSNAIFRGNQIVTAYSGSDKSEKPPTQFHVFDVNGNYLKTLEVGYRILRFCYDKDTDRLIICFNDEIQFGYLSLKDLIG